VIGPLLALLLSLPHPIHTTVLELRWDARTRGVEGTLRVFEDDLLAASSRERLTASAYVLRHLELTVAGKPVPLRACGERRAADAVLVCLRGETGDPRGWRVGNSILMDRYDDQINIVRVDNWTSTTLLLTKRSPSQPAG
jgi:hypothetical protein